MPVAIGIFFIREPEKGANESSHILKAAGMDIETEQENAPKVLLGPAVTRLLRIRSLYYELVAVAILGFAGTGIPLFGSLYFQRRWHLGVAHRADVFSIIGLSAFLGLPVAFFVGDKLFRRAPEKPLIVAGICIAVFGGLYSLSLYMPHLWMVVVLQFLAQSAVAPLSICIFQTLAATAPPEMRAICFGLFGVYAWSSAASRAGSCSAPSATPPAYTTALTLIGPVCAVGGVLLLVGSRFVRGDITLVIEDVLERYAEGKRRKAGGEIPALQIHNMDFFYGNQQVLFDMNLEVPEGDIVALLGTNGAGQEHAAAGRGRARPPPSRRHPHLRRQLHLPRARADHRPRRRAARRGEDDVPGPERAGEPPRRRPLLPPRDAPGSKAAFDDAIGLFPELEPRLDQPAGTLSGGEQQMLALARVMMSKPRLLMIDELAFGLAPMTVERLMDIVRRVNAEGATVILVEQSVNRAMTLAEHAFFLERGEVRFDGSITDLLSRDDLLRPVFLASVGAALGNGAGTHPPTGATGQTGRRRVVQRLEPPGHVPTAPHRRAQRDLLAIERRDDRTGTTGSGATPSGPTGAATRLSRADRRDRPHRAARGWHRGWHRGSSRRLADRRQRPRTPTACGWPDRRRYRAGNAAAVPDRERAAYRSREDGRAPRPETDGKDGGTA